MNRKITIFATATTWMLCYGATVNAGIFGEGLSDAFQEELPGRMIDGSEGAASGAIVGGVFAAGDTASGESLSGETSAQQEPEAVRQRKAEWAAGRQAEQERVRAAQPETRPASSIEQTLLVETQRSLVRLGYEPGDIGSPGDALTNAVIAYQQAHGLLETGELSQALLEHMLKNGG